MIEDSVKIYKLNDSEYILTSDEGYLNKIKGEDSKNIVKVLKSYQKYKDLDSVKDELIKTYNLESESIELVFNWLVQNKFISSITNITKEILFIGEFNNDYAKINELSNKLSDNINAKILDITSELKINKSIDLVILFGPLWYDDSVIIKLSEIMKNSNKDFIYIEPHKNGITLGPLMNSKLNTLCINCLYKRKLINSYNPRIIIENIKNNSIESDNQINILNIGNFSVHKSFIINEIEKLLNNNSKIMYNKSIFIDYLNYNSQFFKTLKSVDCQICNNSNVFNPL